MRSVLRTVAPAAIVLSLATVAPRSVLGVITITEIMYHPAGGDRSLEYIELHNEAPDPMDITGYYFSAGVTFVFTERTFLDPGATIVVCASKEAIRAKYGIENVAGDWDAETSLDNSGEAVELANPAGVVEARVRYNDRGKWPSGADGTGHSLELAYVYSEMDDPDNWALSGAIGGSPGKANNPTQGAIALFVNEGLLAGDPGTRWIEIYNADARDIDLGGFHVSTDRLDLKKGTIPAGTLVPAGKWVALTEAALGLDLTPDATGRTFVALSTPGAGRVLDAHIFEPEQAGLSEARTPDGDSLFSAAADPTPGEANVVTVEGNLVINEVLYHPIDGDASREFIELYNRGSEPVDLTGWRLAEGVRFDFPAGTTIAADAYLVVARDPERVRAVYGLPAGTVIGPADSDALERFGTLSDEGERVTLEDARGNIADTVRYHDGGEWPRWADAGSSMELIDPFQDNAAAQAWDSSDDFEKAPVKRIEYTGTFSAGEPELHLVLTGAGIALVDDIVMSSRVSTLVPAAVFIDFGDVWRYFKGTSEASDPPEAWRGLDFDDAAWLEGAAPIGYGENDEATRLEDMNGQYGAVFFRKAFDLPDPAAVESLVLDVEFDDGYAAYLNGTEVAVSNMRSPRTFDAGTPSPKDKAKETLDLTARKDLLRSGKNVLAVQVHNQTKTSNDFRWKARLVSGHFDVQEGPNVVKDGTFDTDAYKTLWTIQGTHYRSGRTTRSPLSGDGSLKVIATGSGDNKVNRIETSNAGMAALATRTLYSISFLSRWVVGSPTLLTHGAYSSSASPSFAASHRLAVPENLGTPGAVNSVTLRQVQRTGTRSMGPVISRVRQTPVLPGASEPVRIAARVRDPDGVASVTLYWSLETPKPIGDAALSAVPMTDPDGDGVYEGEVPGQAARKRVIYHIVAADAQGREGRFPLDHVSRTHPLLLDPAAAGVNDPLYAIYRHDAPFTGKMHSYRFWMHQANEQYMSSRPLLSNDMVDGSFVFQGRDMYYNARIRFAGSPFARQPWSESYRLRMPKDRPLHGSIESFNMEDHQGAGARDGRERISHYLIRYNQGPTTAPYSLQWLVQLQVGDRVNEVREHVQTPNGEFLQRWWRGDSDGAFFEMDDRHTITDAGSRQESTDGRLLYPPYGPVALGADKEQYRYYFSLRQNEDLDDFSDLVELARLLTTAVTPNDEFDKQVFDRIDVDAFCRVWAVRLNTDDWDQWSGTRGKNCYLYRAPRAGRWYLLPWDMELTYGNVSAFMPPNLTATSNPSYSSGFTEVMRFLNRPQVKRIYYGVMKEMVDGHFRSSFLVPYMQKLDSIGVVSTQVGKPNGYIDQRRNLLVNAVKGVTKVTIPLSVTTNGGAPLEIETEAVLIEGRAPVEVRFIEVLAGGATPATPFEVAFSTTSVLGWSATGTLPLGSHDLTIVGLDASGELVDSIHFQVTRIEPAPPAITAIAPRSLVAGERAVIAGTGFKAGLKVRFGDVEAAELRFDPTADPGRIEVVTPSGLAAGDLDVRVANSNGLSSEPYAVRIVAEKRRFIRGDADRSATLELTDAVVMLRFLFQGGEPPSCLDAADADDDGALGITDAIVLLRFLFQGGAAPPAPHPDAGEDGTADPLDCALGME
ncbi:MAG: lamin tail domain-containing protein [Planctomycetes bacterium]|nr:lamin tail domain-containing protein [Planctomycetota bacterium]